MGMRTMIGLRCTAKAVTNTVIGTQTGAAAPARLGC